MFSLKKKLYISLIFVIALVVLWNYESKYLKSASTNNKKLLFSSFSSNSGWERITETVMESQSNVSSPGNSVSVELPPYSYVRRNAAERDTVGIDVELLLAHPRDILKFQPPRYLPNYRNPCFPIDYNNVVKYAKGSDTHRNTFLDIDGTDLKDHKKAVICFPSIYLVGWAKCGSTELASYIQEHPLVYNGPYEVHFWSREVPIVRGGHKVYPLTLLQYTTRVRLSTLNDTRIEQYTGKLTYDKVNYPELYHGTNIYGKNKLIGDYTPTYAYGFETQVPNKLQHIVPDAKIMFSLRDPVDRTFSHLNYNFKFALGDSFSSSYDNNATAMSQQMHRLLVRSIDEYNRCLDVYCENFCATKMPDDKGDFFSRSIETAALKALITSLYHVSIAKFMESFPPENLLIIDLGEFSKRPFDYLDETLFPFLGLEPFSNDTRRRVMSRHKQNGNVNKQPLVDFLPETREVLKEFFRIPQQKLQKLANGRHFSWFSKYDL